MVFAFVLPLVLLLAAGNVHADSNMTNTTNATTTILSSAPLTISLATPPTTVDAGQSVTFTNSSAGGSGPLTYSYFAMGGTYVANGDQITFMTPGTYYVSETVSDGTSSATSASVEITVDPLPTVSLTATSDSVYTGQSVTFTNSSTGTGLAFSYAVSGGTEGTDYVFNGSQATFMTAGTYNVTESATDGLGGIGTSSPVSIEVSVKHSHHAAQASAASTVAPSNESAQVNASAAPAGATEVAQPPTGQDSAPAAASAAPAETAQQHGAAAPAAVPAASVVAAPAAPAEAATATVLIPSQPGSPSGMVPALAAMGLTIATAIAVGVAYYSKRGTLGQVSVKHYPTHH